MSDTGGFVELTRDEVARLVGRAALGDRLAWRRVVEAYGELVWAVSRAEGLSRADAEDVCQTTWLRLAERLGDLREPGSLPRWLIVTTRRSARRLARTRRLEPISPPEVPEPPAPRIPGGEDDSLWTALESLPIHCQRILRIQAFLPEWTYHHISRATGIPVGNIGSTRTRCLRRLKAVWTEQMAGDLAG